MLLDSIQDVHAVLAVHHVHGQAPLAKAAGAPDPVQVGLVVRVPVLVHGEVKVDDDRHLFHVDPCVRESWTRVSTGDRNRRRPARPTLTQLRRKAGSGTGQLWGWDTGRWQNPEGEDGPSRCWPNSGISQRAPAGSEDLEKQLTPHWGQEEQAPSSATSQHSRLLWTVSSAESPPQARPQNSISPKPPQPPTHEDPPAPPEPGGPGPGLRSPRAHTLVVTRTFSLPSRKRSITAALCSTTISPLSRATWWPSFESSAASQLAVLRVWSEKNCFK